MSSGAPLPRVTITYCTQCRWLLRAAWFAQELLSTFHRELGEVALRPATGGVFTVEVDGELLWDRAERRGFPEITVLKQLVRDRVAPDKPLGHSDAKAAAGASDAAAQDGPADADPPADDLPADDALAADGG
ncbi:SelT/SelW/SelH family protein [Cellulomonas cellasea]|uniref:Selenoprotein W-related protein n=1 Tax=Cellulomonas cellasea TaxID=43670 RepID=A0A7W4UGT8_9CELL|nr:SelT/SelW/SelH family protein [Cellulomonas cellasea]MBB2923923.1 selenoprotein W-related protein [Cellulomonas cellasea]